MARQSAALPVRSEFSLAFPKEWSWRTAARLVIRDNLPKVIIQLSKNTETLPPEVRRRSPSTTYTKKQGFQGVLFQRFLKNS